MSRTTTNHSPTAALAWGYNNLGGLGTGTTARAVHPIRAAAVPTGTVDLQGGTDFSVALTESGEVWTWGGNAHGQLGDATRTSRRNATQVDLPRVSSISAGAGHVLATTTKGDLYAWGENLYGQLGDGTRVDQPAPVKIAAIGRGVRVATGHSRSVMVDADGRVSVWGQPVPGTASVADERLGLARPLHLPTSVAAEQVAGGKRHLVVLTRDGALLSYGVNVNGKPMPERLELDGRWGRITSISAGDNHTAALTERGTVLSWGGNTCGQLGLRDAGNRRHPAAVRLPRTSGRVVQVLAAGDSTFARTDEHTIYAWGHGAFGQIGNHATTNQSRPQPVSLPDAAKVISLHGGRFHVVGLTHSTH